MNIYKELLSESIGKQIVIGVPDVKDTTNRRMFMYFGKLNEIADEGIIMTTNSGSKVFLAFNRIEYARQNE